MANKLTINVSKMQLLLFSNWSTVHEANSLVSCKYLGVYVDSKLKFKQHITYVTLKVSKIAGKLIRIRDSLPFEARLDYYYCVGYPCLT